MSRSSSGLADLSPVASELLDLLLSQQTRDGLHFGQFGDHRDQSQGHQPSRVIDIAHKPRLYMTLWPCRVLRRRGLAEDAVLQAIKGVQSLFVKGIVPGEENNDPIPPRRRYVSYRHSICGALILFEMTGRNPITDGVLSKMLDWQSPWRASDRGWAHGDAQPGQSDLYTSLYAIELLSDVHFSAEVDADLDEVAMDALETSLDYLDNAWEANGWGYGELKAEETFPLAFAEVADILQKHRPELFKKVSAEILLHRNPVGGMRASYRERVKQTVSDQSCLARLAYAAYLAGHASSVWRGFARLALDGELQRLTSAEIAWLLDLELIPESSSHRASVGFR